MVRYAILLAVAASSCSNAKQALPIDKASCSLRIELSQIANTENREAASYFVKDFAKIAKIIRIEDEYETGGYFNVYGNGQSCAAFAMKFLDSNESIFVGMAIRKN